MAPGWRLLGGGLGDVLVDDGLDGVGPCGVGFGGGVEAVAHGFGGDGAVGLEQFFAPALRGRWPLGVELSEVVLDPWAMFPAEAVPEGLCGRVLLVGEEEGRGDAGLVEGGEGAFDEASGDVLASEFGQDGGVVEGAAATIMAAHEGADEARAEAGYAAETWVVLEISVDLLGGVE